MCRHALALIALLCASTSATELEWQAPTTCTDGSPLEQIEHFTIYRDRVAMAQVAGDQTSYESDFTPSAGETVCYEITATGTCDASEPSESYYSNAGCVTGDGTEPEPEVRPDPPVLLTGTLAREGRMSRLALPGVLSQSVAGGIDPATQFYTDPNEYAVGNTLVEMTEWAPWFGGVAGTVKLDVDGKKYFKLQSTNRVGDTALRMEGYPDLTGRVEVYWKSEGYNDHHDLFMGSGTTRGGLNGIGLNRLFASNGWRVVRFMDGNFTQLGFINLPPSGLYEIKMVYDAGLFEATVWLAGDPEPVTPQYSQVITANIGNTIGHLEFRDRGQDLYFLGLGVQGSPAPRKAD